VTEREREAVGLDDETQARVRAALTPQERAALLAECEAHMREPDDHGAAMRSLAGCRCGEHAGHVQAIDVELDDRGIVTFAACRACGARREHRGTVRENIDTRRRTIYRERLLRREIRVPARLRAVCASARRSARSGRPRGRRGRRSGRAGPSGDPGSDEPGEHAGPQPEGGAR